MKLMVLVHAPPTGKLGMREGEGRDKMSESQRQARSESPFLTSTVLRSFLSFSLSKSCLDGKRRPQRLNIDNRFL